MATPMPPSTHFGIEQASLHNDPVDPELRALAREVIRRGEAKLEEMKRAASSVSAWITFNTWMAPDPEEMRISAEIEMCRKVASPVRDAPAEVLEEIFAYCAALQPITIWHLPDEPMAMAPWSLTGVSRKWRQVALGQSSLWARIHAAAFINGAQNNRSRLLRNACGDDRLELVLQRSGSARLDLSIGWLDNWGSTEIPVLLLSTSARLRTLEFKAAPTFDQVNADPRLAPFLNFLGSEQDGTDFSSLEEIKLQLGSAPIDRFLILRSARNVRKLSITSNFLFQSLFLSTLHNQLHLNNLRYLRLSDRRLPTQVLYQVLCHSPSLEYLGVTASSLSSSWLDASTLPIRCTLPKLTELSVTIYGDKSSADVLLWWLQRLRLPNLRAFTLGTDGGRSVWGCPIKQLNAIEASGKLERLSIDVNVYLGDMVRLLQALPKIQALELRNVCPAPSLLRHFASKDFLPDLTTLKCGLHRVRLIDFVQMTLLRARDSSQDSAIYPFKRVELATMRDEDWDAHIDNEPIPSDSLKSLRHLKWKVQVNPPGWEKQVLAVDSPKALVVLHRKEASKFL